MADRRSAGAARPARPHRTLLVVITVVALLITAEFVMITAQTAPRPPLQPARLQSLLPAGTSSAPALTWTNAHVGATGGPVDLGGKRPLVVAACEGGGAIAVALSATTSLTLDCSAPGTAGPIPLDRGLSDPARRIDVEVTSGNPRYVVELVAATT